MKNNLYERGKLSPK